MLSRSDDHGVMAFQHREIGMSDPCRQSAEVNAAGGRPGGVGSAKIMEVDVRQASGSHLTLESPKNLWPAWRIAPFGRYQMLDSIH